MKCKSIELLEQATDATVKATDLMKRYVKLFQVEKERADKLESLVRDVERVLERMKFLSEEGLMIDEIDDYQLDVAIAKAKEVLEDE